MLKISIAHCKERLGILEKNLQLHEIQVAKIVTEMKPELVALCEVDQLHPSQMVHLSEIDGLLGYATSVRFKLRKCREELRKALGDNRETL